MIKDFNLKNFSQLDKIKDLCFAEAKNNGFHNDEDNDEKISNFGDYTSNLHSEVSELWEAWRKGSLHKECDKAEKMIAAGLEPLTCAEEEVADIIIRGFDTGKRLNVNIARAVYNKLLFNRTRGHRFGNKLA